ncbi:hypothetical protein SARC_12497 [Sphaeroforma arctica JP610]|uniref:Uncharacterized protein n=1 Tax=Sphaeroforma arctica JP610 TaxID=667725 RepID=A0A0L0FDW9_9EUKA|nr:hypothetical protein SARC_12497 [Sphaeroforma arctica JP610]KNC74967.1 hypothetical protein SARC_12497 [Sphaeroforma arctica JP610]|eukprot:XP_014148869.1 hypothetical protein SARC_12497 [Sphaeroforma arctica JP610]
MTVSSMIASLEAFEARRHLDQNTNKDVQAMLAHGGVALAMDYNIIVSTEDDKIFLTEQLITTFVNKVLKFELGVDGNYGPPTYFYDDAFGVDVKKVQLFDPRTNRIRSHGESVGTYKDKHIWIEDRYVDESGNLHWITKLGSKG